MKPDRWITLLMAATLALPLSLSAAGKAKGKESNKEPAETGKKVGQTQSIPFQGNVKALDNMAKTITLAGKEFDRQFQVTSDTRFVKTGKPAVMADVVAGGKITGSYKDVDGKLNLVTVYIGGKDADKSEGKAGEKNKEKKKTKEKEKQQEKEKTEEKPKA